jgi:hypothetical protein
MVDDRRLSNVEDCEEPMRVSSANELWRYTTTLFVPALAVNIVFFSCPFLGPVYLLVEERRQKISAITSLSTFEGNLSFVLEECCLHLSSKLGKLRPNEGLVDIVPAEGTRQGLVH